MAPQGPQGGDDACPYVHHRAEAEDGAYRVTGAMIKANGLPLSRIIKDHVRMTQSLLSHPYGFIRLTAGG